MLDYLTASASMLTRKPVTITILDNTRITGIVQNMFFDGTIGYYGITVLTDKGLKDVTIRTIERS
jgi:hypothetical protein